MGPRIQLFINNLVTVGGTQFWELAVEHEKALPDIRALLIAQGSAFARVATLLQKAKEGKASLVDLSQVMQDLPTVKTIQGRDALIGDVSAKAEKEWKVGAVSFIDHML